MDKYKTGFFLLMQYFDSIPEEDRKLIDKKLKEIGL